MKSELLEKLSRISEVEKSVMADNYSLLSDAEPAFANMSLRRRDYLFNVIGSGQQMVGARPHTRFVGIPLHAHNYLEMMYVCRGSIIHFIEGQTYVLEEGDLLVLNRHAKHSVAAAGAYDLAVNLIVSPDFPALSSARFRHHPALRDFSDEDRRTDGKSRFLIFRTIGLPAVANLMENLIEASLFEKQTPQILLTDTLSLLFRYLEMYPDTLLHTTGARESDLLRQRIEDYIQTTYRSATLSELSDRLGLSAPYVSRRVKEIFGASFSDLVKDKRFSEAEQLLLHSDLSVSVIAETIGYENNSFFHRRFREQYGMSPTAWRKQKQ
ncbi:MAG: helix-turn-helix domain-containing protein [Ruminococcaceae bacterium]|nr:helix-turn-helix domain-containing protein [Oscillospiraceae bacterium]